MRHPYNILSPSPWPMLISLNLLSLLISFLGIINGYINSKSNIIITIIVVLYILFLWFYDLIIESNYIGLHSKKVSYSIIVGYILFIVTEIFLFLSFFWAYFHSAFNPFFLIWPPIGIEIINPWSIPLLNTLLLLYSGIFATWAHHSFLSKNRTNTIYGLLITILLGLIFFFFQLFEYSYSSFDISDSVYGSTFFLLTGTHGLHVIIGLLLIFISLLKIINYFNSSILFDLSLLYWHFVDIVWIALFILIYYLAY